MEKFNKIILCEPVSGRMLYPQVLFCSFIPCHWPDCWHQVCLAAPQWQELKGLNGQLRISWVPQELVDNSSPLFRGLSYGATFSRFFYPELSSVALCHGCLKATKFCAITAHCKLFCVTYWKRRRILSACVWFHVVETSCLSVKMESLGQYCRIGFLCQVIGWILIRKLIGHTVWIL